VKKISINCDAHKREQSIKRMHLYCRREYLDRVPVYFGVEARYFLKERGIGFLEYFESPEKNLYHQLMNFKWRMEHLEDDGLGREDVVVFPDFQNTTTAGLFDFGSIAFSDTETPRVEPFITTIEDLRKLEPPDLHREMGAKKRDYLIRMKELAKDCEVQVNGEPIDITVCHGWHETMGTGALDMLGQNFYLWMIEYPEEIKQLLDMLTRASIDYEYEMRKISGIPANGGETIADGMEMLSRDMFDEFIVPPYLRYYEAFPGSMRGFHNCGNINHLLESIRYGLGITVLNGFGYSVDIVKLASMIGDQMSCSGGLNPVTLWNGSDSEVFGEVRSYIEALGPSRAYMLGDGYNVVPGTSIERMNKIAGLAEEIGLDF